MKAEFTPHPRGGTKKRQQNDIEAASRHWRSYKARKAAERTRRK
ncbi:MAG: hypothetical protein Q7T45_13055 [Bradyrhizobium sp.]|nr:hypothetical protein [Bradyrhizobium sp.]MDO8398739.1 hypothetical protein [Bradyrhizobium sp.]